MAKLLALATVVCLASPFFSPRRHAVPDAGSADERPRRIENCSACHAKSGSGKLSWVHGLVAGDPVGDSKACLASHKMPDAAFNAHSASAEVLKMSTKRLSKSPRRRPSRYRLAPRTSPSRRRYGARGLYCATCHQEHQGVGFNLNKISNEQCHSCHVVKFDSFDGDHPEFENYPFKRRTRIIYDHAGHFGKHFPEVAKKDPESHPHHLLDLPQQPRRQAHHGGGPIRADLPRLPSRPDHRQGAGQRPKGIAFLTLPGLDLQTLKGKNAAIGEWPDESEARVTPFMKVMISRNERAAP